MTTSGCKWTKPKLSSRSKPISKCFQSVLDVVAAFFETVVVILATRAWLNSC